MRRWRKPVSCAGSGLSWCDLDVTGLDATGLAVPGARGQAGDSDAASRTHAPRSRRNRIMQESNHTSILRVERRVMRVERPGRIAGQFSFTALTDCRSRAVPFKL